MAEKSRGQTIDVNDIVNLTVQFKDSLGQPVNTDTLPSVSIIQPTGHILLTPTTTGVTLIAPGKYQYAFQVPINGPYGTYNDLWSGLISGFYVESTLSFTVVKTDIPSINSDGYAHLGDDFPFTYSQAAINNINKLLKMLRARLNSSGKTKAKDQYGNVIYVDCDIFSVDMLVTFLGSALSHFNSIPYFTFFNFDDSGFVAQFGQIIVDGAAAYAMASHALIAKGYEVNISDQGINFTPPSISDLLNTQAGSLITMWNDNTKMIKNSMRPFPKSMGTFSFTSSGLSPAYNRLRHMRQKRYY